MNEELNYGRGQYQSNIIQGLHNPFPLNNAYAVHSSNPVPPVIRFNHSYQQPQPYIQQLNIPPMNQYAVQYNLPYEHQNHMVGTVCLPANDFYGISNNVSGIPDQHSDVFIKPEQHILSQAAHRTLRYQDRFQNPVSKNILQASAKCFIPQNQVYNDGAAQFFTEKENIGILKNLDTVVVSKEEPNKEVFGTDQPKSVVDIQQGTFNIEEKEQPLSYDESKGMFKRENDNDVSSSNFYESKPFSTSTCQNELVSNDTDTSGTNNNDISAHGYSSSDKTNTRRWQNRNGEENSRKSFNNSRNQYWANSSEKYYPPNSFNVRENNYSGNRGYGNNRGKGAYGSYNRKTEWRRSNNLPCQSYYDDRGEYGSQNSQRSVADDRFKFHANGRGNYGNSSDSYNDYQYGGGYGRHEGYKSYRPNNYGRQEMSQKYMTEVEYSKGSAPLYSDLHTANVQENGYNQKRNKDKWHIKSNSIIYMTNNQGGELRKQQNAVAQSVNNAPLFGSRAEEMAEKNVDEALQIEAVCDKRPQRETLIELLTKGIYECMVCCDRIKQQQAIWSCNKCYNCFHLGCIKKWAGASQGEPGWRCPACQNQNSKIPSGYFCFCKKLREPEWNRRETPHSCGEVCGQKRENEWCTHKCTNLCHPGPCPDCSAFIKRTCCCGKNSKSLRCAGTEPYLCDEKCLKVLNCGVHSCQEHCHSEPCKTCEEVAVKECYCSREKKPFQCTEESASEVFYSCGSLCKKTLSCNQHTCQKICHSGPCDSCEKSIEVVQFCPCGKVSLAEYYKKNSVPPRRSCSDSIPTCGNICDKVLKCGTPGSYHKCQAPCHDGSCPPCQGQTAVKCRCGFMDQNIPCSELSAKADEVTCEKQCKKLRQCGRHKCGVKCCIDADHVCDRICGKTLKCRLHKCQEQCHRGNCPRCWETSFEELSCHCGSSVIYPPVPCGTESPVCNLPCQRLQSCSHSVSHSCHPDPICPPCTTLVSKPCFGKHMVMKSTPCYINALSCGEQCGKTLPCGLHKCLKVCHGGKCIESTKCNQKCSQRRNSCDHLCSSPCHAGPCPNTPCKDKVTVSCICGNRTVEMGCSENDREYKSLATSKLASMMHNMNSGGSVDISHIFNGGNKVEKFKRLDCNDDCGLLERNRRLALALQITNPDARKSLGEETLYPESLKEEAKKDMQFATMVHNTLNDLVLKAKESKQKTRSHSFIPMNRDKRRFIHEYSKFFGCQSQSYDEEPKKNVVVTACKQTSRLPPVSVLSVVLKEQGQRKVPGPVLPRKIVTDEENSTTMKRLEKSSSFERKEVPAGVENNEKQNLSSEASKKPPPIDYFDFS